MMYIKSHAKTLSDARNEFIQWAISQRDDTCRPKGQSKRDMKLLRRERYVYDNLIAFWSQVEYAAEDQP